MGLIHKYKIRKQVKIMSQTLIFIETHYTTTFSHTSSYDEQVIDNTQKSLDAYCNNLSQLLEQFKYATNFDNEIEKIPSQLEVNNFAQVTFKEPLVEHYVTIVAPKFE